MTLATYSGKWCLSPKACASHFCNKMTSPHQYFKLNHVSRIMSRTMFELLHYSINSIVCWPMWTYLRGKQNSLRPSTSTFLRYLIILDIFETSLWVLYCFPQIYDIKYLMKSCKNLKGGLQVLGIEKSIFGRKPPLWDTWSQIAGGCWHSGGQEDRTSAPGWVCVFFKNPSLYWFGRLGLTPFSLAEPSLPWQRFISRWQ